MAQKFVVNFFYSGIALVFCCCTTKILFAQESIGEVFTQLQQEITSEQQNFPQGDFSDKEYVKTILGEMCTIDQSVREELIKECGPDLISHPEALQLMSSMDDFHTIKIKEILQQYGWITISQFGEVADDEAWLLVQHSGDLFFQESCLFILSDLVAQGETSKKNYAYLYDRVAIQSLVLGKQRYGTQLNLANNEFILFPYEGTLEQLDQRRAGMGLSSEEEYLKKVKEIYYPQQK